MNTISQFTPNYTGTTQSKRQNVQFTGNLGDKFVNQIINGTSVKPSEMIKEMKGTFGIKTDKAEDILESFIGKVRDLFKEKTGLSMKINEQERQIRSFPQEQENAVDKARNEMREYWQNIVRSKDEQMALKDKEVADMKSQLEKYQQVAKVKSVEEIGTVMPDRAIEIMEEMIENKIASRKSMAEFLLTGKGQEEALKQIERNNTILKANQDGIIKIPEVNNKNNEMNKAGVHFSQDYYFTLNLIESALKGSPNGSYVKSQALKKQIKENAMAILTPMADDRYCNTTVNALSAELDKRLSLVEQYHDGLPKGIEKMKTRIGKDYSEVKFESVEFAPDESKVIMKGIDGGVWSDDYEWLARFGNSQY